MPLSLDVSCFFLKGKVKVGLMLMLDVKNSLYVWINMVNGLFDRGW